MNKRFVWNFEIRDQQRLNLAEMPLPTTDEVRWESRFFWPSETIITLNAPNDAFLNLANFKIKHRTDQYYLLPKKPYNIKLRSGQLIYKPILKEKGQAFGYGKKIKLDNNQQAALPNHQDLTPQQLTDLTKHQARIVLVEKEILTYTFPLTPKTKLELAQLKIVNAVYYTLSVESRAFEFLEAITKHLLDNPISCDYVTFLKSL